MLLVAERRLPMALATAPYTSRALRSYRLGQRWLVLEGVRVHNVAIDFAAESCGSGRSLNRTDEFFGASQQRGSPNSSAAS